MPNYRLILATTYITACSFAAYADEMTCGPLTGTWVGPWDYYDPANRVPTGDAPQTRIKLVENVHFKAAHANLSMPNQHMLAGDIIYTLRAIPNHPGALHAVSRLEARHKGNLPGKKLNWETADCFFDRAIRFRPDDAMVRQVYGIHLHSLKKYSDARDQFLKAKELGEPSAQLEYNLGLTYFELGDIEQAKVQAKLAFSLNFPLQGLKNKLQRAGHWNE